MGRMPVGAVGPPGEAQVKKGYVSIGRNEDVLGLHVPVHPTGTM